MWPYLLYPASVVSVGALVDSVAEEYLIDREFLRSLYCPLASTNHSRPVKAINKALLETVTHQTAPLFLMVSGNHREHLTFLFISSPVVLGLPWLKLHNPAPST